MIAEYLTAAMQSAHFEQMEDGRYWGEVPAMPGAWEDGDTPEQCREMLREVVEEWTLLGYWQHATLPIIGGIDPNIKLIPEEDAYETCGANAEVL